MSPALRRREAGGEDSPASIRCYAELNDYLASERRHVPFPIAVQDGPSLGAVIAALAIPSGLIDLVLVNGEPVDFDHPVGPGDQVSVYPVFESLDVAPVTRLFGRPLRDPRFVLDVHLGRLARLLRMLGFDALWRDGATDDELVRIAAAEHRILLTRDRALAGNPRLARVRWLEPRKPAEQIAAVLAQFDLYGRIRPFTRCMVCNGAVAPVEKREVAHRLLPGTLRDHGEFFACGECGKLYWKGSHYRNMQVLIEKLMQVARTGEA